MTEQPGQDSPGTTPCDSAWPAGSHVEAKLDELRSRWPGWSFWLSRHHLLIGATLRDPAAGVSRTVVADNVAHMDKEMEQELKAAAGPRRPQLNPLRRGH